MPAPILIVTQVAPYADGPAGVHGVLGQATTVLCQLAEMAGLSPVVVHDVRDLSPHQLGAGGGSGSGSGSRSGSGSAGVLALFTIGETPFTPTQQAALLDSWHAGHLGVLGVHSATDACHTWPEYGSIVGARFDGHPWTQSFDIEVVGGAHPATAHLGGSWPWRDEIYLFRSLRPDAEVLLRLAPDQVDLSAPGGRVPDCGFPLAWCHEEEKGRTFYSALGHFPGAWETPAFLQHLAGGLTWLQAERKVMGVPGWMQGRNDGGARRMTNLMNPPAHPFYPSGPPRFNHVAMSLPADLLDQGGRDEICRFFGEVLGFEEMPTMTEDRRRLILGCVHWDQFIFLIAENDPMRCPRMDHYGFSVGSLEELQGIQERAEAFRKKDERVDLIDLHCDDQGVVKIHSLYVHYILPLMCEFQYWEFPT